jgi:hypothetical protein
MRPRGAAACRTWLIRDAGALAAHQDGLAAMARTTGEIAASIQAKVATVLGAIQIGDIARQRLEHVLAGCEMLDAHLEGRAPTTAAEEAACHHLLALLHAQLEETAVDFRRETLVLVDPCATLSLRPTACWRCRRPAGLPKIWRPPVNLVPARTGKRDCRGHRHDRPVAGSRRTGRSNLGLIIATVDDLTTRAAAIRHLRVDAAHGDQHRSLVPPGGSDRQADDRDRQ